MIAWVSTAVPTCLPSGPAHEATARIAIISAIASVTMLSRLPDSSVVRRPGVQRGGFGGTTREPRFSALLARIPAPCLEHDRCLEHVLRPAPETRLDHAGRVAMALEISAAHAAALSHVSSPSSCR